MGKTAMRVVLIRLSALGDIIHTWPLAEALRLADPSIHLTWVVEAPFRPLVEGHPAVDAVLTVRTKAWRRRLCTSDPPQEVLAGLAEFFCRCRERPEAIT